jgi:purine catabolism regulator
VPTTIRDLLQDSELDLALIVEGDIDRPIRWVHVTELVDASSYLVGDEFILTTGMWRDRGNTALDFVQALETRSVAGIGFGLLHELDLVPSQLIRACRDRGVPLVVVPISTPFVAISQKFVDRLTIEREAELQRTLRLTKQLLAAADAPSATQALNALVRLLHRETGKDAWISDPTGRLLAHKGTATLIEIRAAATEGSEAIGNQEECSVGDGPFWIVRPLRSGSRVSAIVGMSGPEVDLIVRTGLEAALPVVSLVLARERAGRETERRLAGELISLILGRQIEIATARLTAYGVNPKHSLLAIVCSVADREQSLMLAEDWLADWGRPGVFALRGNELFALLEVSSLTSPVDAGEITSNLVVHIGASAAGVGSISSGIDKLRRSLIEADQSCRLASRQGGGTVLSHQLAGSHTFLLALQDQDVADAFHKAVLGELEEYDRQHGSDLIATIRTFLKLGGRWQETANALSLHVSSVRYRLDLVEKLTGRRLDKTSDRVDFWLALEGWEGE